MPCRDEVKWCLYSISDNASYLRSNKKPIDDMIVYLKEFFRPDKITNGHSLAISSGDSGARLTHSHERHYHFVLQSLSLWRDIVDDMFHLWCLAEDDLLDKTHP